PRAVPARAAPPPWCTTGPARRPSRCCSSFVLRAPATAVISPLSLHDALPILMSPFGPRARGGKGGGGSGGGTERAKGREGWDRGDRKSTRLNSSHDQISYAVVGLEKTRERSPMGSGVGRPLGYAGAHFAVAAA